MDRIPEVGIILCVSQRVFEIARCLAISRADGLPVVRCWDGHSFATDVNARPRSRGIQRTGDRFRIDIRCHRFVGEDFIVFLPSLPQRPGKEAKIFTVCRRRRRFVNKNLLKVRKERASRETIEMTTIQSRSLSERSRGALRFRTLRMGNGLSLVMFKPRAARVSG